ncbi:hypothetical protein CEXT_814321 [Caerostris extrusa]|uniref:Uncharacterized protein n=1 Tax=Caerostris extrusa TaxID=172846 RepID=A0AAV4QZC8_CAEEX|nr:hypothetical protein CEXT_814321 [Caerostris extrusa]
MSEYGVMERIIFVIDLFKENCLYFRIMPCSRPNNPNFLNHQSSAVNRSEMIRNNSHFPKDSVRFQFRRRTSVLTERKLNGYVCHIVLGLSGQ